MRASGEEKQEAQADAIKVEAILPTMLKITMPSAYSVQKTIECGQSFHWKKRNGSGNPEYEIYTGNEVARVKQCRGDACSIVLKCSEGSFERVWREYLNVDAPSLQEMFSRSELIPEEQKVLDYAEGIHLLKQDKWEMLISYIASQRNRVDRIKQIVSRISNKWGEPLENVLGVECKGFPDAQRLIQGLESWDWNVGLGYRHG